MVTTIHRSSASQADGQNTGPDAHHRSHPADITLLREQCSRAATDLYNHECALHDAHQSHDDTWVTAAADRLHESLETHLAALRALTAAETHSVVSGRRSSTGPDA